MKEQDFTNTDKIKIDKKIQELESKRCDLVLKKKEMEVNMMELKNEVRTSPTYLSEQRYKSITDKQVKCRQGILDIENEMNVVKAEISRLRIIRSEIDEDINSIKSFNSKELLNSLLYLKSKYYDFSLDKTRIPAMRKMTQEFIEDLDNLVELIK